MKVFLFRDAGGDFPACSERRSRHLAAIGKKATFAGEWWAAGKSSLAGRIFQALSYLSLCLWLIWIAITAPSDARLAQRLDEIIFVDFFGYFLISLLFANADTRVRWTWPLSVREGAVITGYVATILVAGSFMAGIAGGSFTLVWVLGLVASLSDIAALRTGAALRVIWGVVSAFGIALGSSFGGVPAESLLSDARSLLAWGLLYFGGVFVYRVVRIR